MSAASVKKSNEGLKTARLLMVLSSMSPLFVLWAIRGNRLVPESYHLGFCGLLVLLPNAFLFLRIVIAKHNRDRREMTIGVADDHRDHILVYLFAMLLPFYSVGLDNVRDVVSTLVALCFIIFLFWHLNLHYLNLVFALLGFRVFTVYPPTDGNALTQLLPFVVITRRVRLLPGQQIIMYRLSDSVYLELV